MKNIRVFFIRKFSFFFLAVNFSIYLNRQVFVSQFVLVLFALCVALWLFASGLISCFVLFVVVLLYLMDPV